MVLRPRRACLHLIDTGRFVPRPFHKASHTAHSAHPALRLTGININNGVQGRGRGSSAGGGGRGQGEGLRSSVLRPLASTLRVRPPPPVQA